MTEHDGPRGGTVVHIHDTAYCWETVRTFNTRNYHGLYNVRKEARYVCDQMNSREEALDRGVSKT